MQLTTVVNHTLALLIEIAVLVSFYQFGRQFFAPLVPGAISGLILVGIAIILWARFAAPTAILRLALPLLLPFKAGMFSLAALALLGIGLPQWAALLVVAAVVHLGLAVFLGIL